MSRQRERRPPADVLSGADPVQIRLLRVSTCLSVNTVYRTAAAALMNVMGNLATGSLQSVQRR